MDPSSFLCWSCRALPSGQTKRHSVWVLPPSREVVPPRARCDLTCLPFAPSRQFSLQSTIPRIFWGRKFCFSDLLKFLFKSPLDKEQRHSKTWILLKKPGPYFVDCFSNFLVNHVLVRDWNVSNFFPLPKIKESVFTSSKSIFFCSYYMKKAW